MSLCMLLDVYPPRVEKGRKSSPDTGEGPRWEPWSSLQVGLRKRRFAGNMQSSASNLLAIRQTP